MINKQASCDDFEQAELISVKQALASILSTVKPIKQTQQLALEQTVGRCLMEDIQAHINVPAQNNSAVDGYAVYDADAVHSTARQLLIAGQSFAGKTYKGKIVLGQCLRIMTVATLPTGMTTVIMQEQVAVDGDFIYLDPPYLITFSEYNKIWNEEKEHELLNFLDNLHQRNIKFAISNVTHYKGRVNNIFIDWMKKYNVKKIKSNYISYHDNSVKQIEEVLLINYD
jgi:16S rRNA G966 N2-methylase RsmD